MTKKIDNQRKSPCYFCPVTAQCSKKIERVPKLMENCYKVIFDADLRYCDCGIYISITAPETIKES